MTKILDSKFFTNKEGQSLLERLKQSLPKNTKYFDVLVGYFRASGFLEIYEHLNSINKIRILVGINTDKKIQQSVLNEKELSKNPLSSPEARENYLNNTIKKINSKDSKKIEKGLKKFIELIEAGKLEIKVYPKAPIHAKIYIVRKDPEKVEDFGKVITGSSNFSYSGLKGNLEFNVELKDKSDVKFAKKHFENLWKESVDITEEYVDMIKNNTWMKKDITPYELYLKFLYEYFGKKRINKDKEEVKDFPKDFKKIQYQIDAAQEMIEKIEKYNGAYLADVVGVGKTYITAMIAKILKGSFMIICPPKLEGYWQDVFFKFKIPSYKIFSNGKLDQILRKEDLNQYEYIIVDEAHKFRNEKTQQYEMLERIVAGKKVILISATPWNNEPMDIGSQVFLFQDKYSSDIPGLKNLRAFFKKLQNNIRNVNRKENPGEYFNTVRKSAKRIRDKVLKEIMVRRTRKEIEENYEKDLNKLRLSFPEVCSPERVYYEFDNAENKVFEETIQTIQNLNYSRYTPLLFLKKGKIDLSELTGQYNLKGFMKTLLVKRLDSSFQAFKKTLSKFVDSYNKFIEMYEKGIVLISKEINVYELMENDDIDLILEKFEEAKEKGKEGKQFKSEDFKKDFKGSLERDRDLLLELSNEWKAIKSDPKIEKFISEIQSNKILSNKQNKIIVFSESKDSANYLGEKLKKIFDNKKIKAIHGSSPKSDFDKVKDNFDPNTKEENKEDEIRILIATDALSEGINLHRANIIINYDIPWNPTKVLQRVGRVNRIGQEKKIRIFNFFPVEEAEEAIGLKERATAKLQAFHDALGEDAQYLTQEEESSGQGLFEKINSPDFLEEGDKISSPESKYLSKIRKIRDDDFPLYQKIKKLPARIRSAKSLARKKEQLITYFKVGKVDKIYLSDKKEEIGFTDAMKFVKAKPEEKRRKIPFDKFYQLKQKNIDKFVADLKQDSQKNTFSRGNIKFVLDQIDTLISNDLWDKKERDFLQDVKLAIQVGINDQTISNLKKGLDKSQKIKEKFDVVQNNIDQRLIEKKVNKEKERKERRKNNKVILSEYFTK
jgi:superfamily II DNA or RNA helicase